MPLTGNVKTDIPKLIAEGYPQKQAVAIALNKSKMEEGRIAGETKEQEQSLQLSIDSNVEAIVAQILPKRAVNDGNIVLPLDNPSFYNRAYLSLKRWVKEAKPSILKEHERDGSSYGYVTDIVSMEDGLHAILLFNEETYADYQRGDYRYVSPCIAWNFQADDYVPEQDNRWDAALLEVSLVSVPRFYIGQKPIGSLSIEDVSKVENVSLMTSKLGPDNLGTFFIEEDDMKIEDVMAMVKEALDSHRESLKADLMESVKVMISEALPAKEEVKIEEKVEDKVDLAEPMVTEEEPKETETEVEVTVKEEKKEEEESVEDVKEEEKVDERDLKIKELEDMIAKLTGESKMSEAKISELSDKVSLYEAKERVALDLAGKPHLTSMSETLVETYRKDKDLYGKLLTMEAPSLTSAFSERITVGYTSTSNSLPSDPFKAASIMSQRTGKTYTECFNELTKG